MAFLRVNNLGGTVARGLGLIMLWMYASTIGCLVEWACLGFLVYTAYELYRANVTSDESNKLKVSRKDVVLITGCDKGLGQAAADKLAEKFTVIATVIDPEGPAAAALTQKGIVVVKLDLTKRESVVVLAETVETFLGEEERRLHGIINNAGMCVMGELDWLSVDQIDRVFAVNLNGPVFLTKLLLPRIIENKTRIVNVTGVNGTVPGSGMSAYCAGKFGLEGFSDALRLELSKYEVRVITVRPGDYSSVIPFVEDEQAKHSIDMWAAMPRVKRDRYAQRFDAFYKMIATNRGKFSASNFEGIRAVFEDTMINKEPQIEYNEGEVLYIFIYTLLMLVPRTISTQVINFFSERDLRKFLFFK